MTVLTEAERAEIAIKLAADVQRRFDDLQQQLTQSSNEARDQLADAVKSLEAQLRSITATITSNHTSYTSDLITLKRDFAAHQERDEMLHKTVDDKLRDVCDDVTELATQLGTESGKLSYRVGEMEKVHEQAKGIKLFLIAIASLLAASLTALNVWHVFYSGH